MKLQREVNALLTAISPTTNPVTDRFGGFRDWGADSWHPGAGYSPIHTGQDHSTRPKPTIRMPVSGTHWGDWRDHPVGSYVMIIPSIEGSPAEHSAIYLLHCEPTSPQWMQVNQGSHLTDHGGHGIGAPHLHAEIAVTPELGAEIREAAPLDMTPVGTGHWRARARAAQLDVGEVLVEIGHQIQGFALEQITRDVIVRGSYPEYRLSNHSRLGEREIWILNPAKIFGRGI